MTPEEAAGLRAPFPPETVGKIPKGGALLDYVGHAAVTDRLLLIDPDWTWGPPTADELQRLPGGDGMWIKLTVCGVTRFGWGDGKNVKEWISDAIRNAAMRFGVALDLWSKEDLSALSEHSGEAGGGSREISAAASSESTSRQITHPSSPAPEEPTPGSAAGPTSTGARKPEAEGITVSAGKEVNSMHPPAASGTIGKNTLQRLRSRASALVADKQPVADMRHARGLPKIDEQLTEEQATEWSALLDDMEQQLERPFDEAAAIQAKKQRVEMSA